jgi:predicted nucleotidyltransferase
MITFHKLEQKLGEHSERLHAEFQVRSLAVFGSVARGDEHPGSDVDFLVQFENSATFDQYMNLKFFLEDLLGCPVDLVTQDAVRPQTRSFIEGDARRVA